jgi:hypothetical protein
MKVGRGELWKGKRAEGISLILCEKHVKEMVDNLYADRTLISAMLEPLEDVDEAIVKLKHLSSETDMCQIPECEGLARCKFTLFMSMKLNEWHKLKPPP